MGEKPQLADRTATSLRGAEPLGTIVAVFAAVCALCSCWTLVLVIRRSFTAGFALSCVAAIVIFALVIFLIRRRATRHATRHASSAADQPAPQAPPRDWFKLYLIIQAASLPCMLVAARLLMGNICNDYHILFDIAVAHVDGQPNPWPFEYGQYPNNHLMLMSMIYLFEAIRAIAPAAGATTLMWIHVILNVVCIQISLLLVANTARVMLGRAQGALCGALMLVCVPFWINAQNVYSDTVGLLFVACQLRVLAQIWLHAHDGARSLAGWVVLLGVFAGIGFEIKATSAVVMVAAVVCAWFACTPKRAGAITAGALAAFLACVVCAGALVDAVRPADLPYDETIQNEYKYPYVHWLMMALNEEGEGAYFEDDYFFTRSFPTYEAKRAADEAVLASRLEALGAGGVLRQVAIVKPTTLWGLGALIRTYELEALMQSDGVMGRAYPLVIGFAQTWHLLMLACVTVAAACLAGRRRQAGEALARFRRGEWEGDDERRAATRLVFVLTLFIAAFGLCAFLCGIWEVKPRYLIHVMPLFVLLATFGWECLARLVCTGRARRL